MKISRPNPQLVIFKNFHDDLREAVIKFAEECARSLQALMAEAFETSRTFAGSLKANKASYNVEKVLSGEDPRRGHQSGRLQAALHRQDLWVLRTTRKTVRLVFSEARLFAEVPYAVYFAEAKARGGTIVGVQQAWVEECRREARDLEARDKRLRGKA